MSAGEEISLRLGDYREVMRDVHCDALISDCPYSERTHAGQRTGLDMRVPTIDYDSIDEPWCHEFAAFWAPRTINWAVVFCDHTAFTWHESAWRDVGWYVFAPVLLKTNPVPRFSGDGPALALEFMVVARPRRADVVPLGSFPGWHEATLDGNDVRVEGVAGRKALGLMRDVVRTYTLPGALVADATAGSGTTAIACQLEGRRCVASEVRPATFEKAQLRIAHGNSALRSPNQTRMEF